MSELYLIRHAQASFDAEDYDQLSALGQQQSLLLGEYFARQKIQFDWVACGTMRRHRQTLEGICKYQNSSLNAPDELPGINEYDFRTLTEDYVARFPNDPLWLAVKGQPSDKKGYYRLLRNVLAAWQAEQFETRGEQYSDFQQRVAGVSEWLIEKSAQNRRIALVGSGGSLALLVGAVLGLADDKVIELNLQTKNTAIHHCFANCNGIKLASWNNAPHLETSEHRHLLTYG